MLVDDHVVTRVGLSMLIGDESNMTVAGEADDGLQAVQLLRNLQPDVKICCQILEEDLVSVGA
ncbi:MAG: hypothetical protein WBO58_07805 [Gammaproteobacteria bacterium]